MTPSPAQPPIAPSIAAQQAPLAQYAQQQAAGGYAPEQQGQNSLTMVQALLTSCGNDLERVAKVLVVEHPELIPILKSAVQALAMLNDEITKLMAPDNGAATQAQAMPQSGAVSAGM